MKSILLIEWFLFIKFLGDDANGERFKEAAVGLGVRLVVQTNKKLPTGVCACLVTGQSRFTLRSHLYCIVLLTTFRITTTTSFFKIMSNCSNVSYPLNFCSRFWNRKDFQFSLEIITLFNTLNGFSFWEVLECSQSPIKDLKITNAKNYLSDKGI